MVPLQRVGSDARRRWTMKHRSLALATLLLVTGSPEARRPSTPMGLEVPLPP
jgi:hypothetical protein